MNGVMHRRVVVPASIGPLGVAAVVLAAAWFVLSNITATNDAQDTARAASAIRADLATLALVDSRAGESPDDEELLRQIELGLDERLDDALANVGRAESEVLRSLVDERVAAARSGTTTSAEVIELMDVQFAALAQDAADRADAASATTIRATYGTAVLALVALMTAVLLTGRVRASQADEAARSDAEDRYRALLENAPLLVYVIGPDGTLEYASPRAQAVYGRSTDRVESLARQLAPEHAAFAQSLIDQTVACDEPHIVQSVGGPWFEVVVTDHRDLPAIAGLVVTARDVSERVELEALLRREATQDVLTGTSNRRGLDLALARAANVADGSETSIAVLLIDLDGFKQINDELGHGAGDDVLSQVGERLRGLIRDGEQVARYGGDEFAVIVEGVEAADDAESVATRLLDALRVPYVVDGEIVTLGASIGIAVGARVEPGELLESADRAMYVAKAAGGGCWRWADEGAAPSPAVDGAN